MTSSQITLSPRETRPVALRVGRGGRLCLTVAGLALLGIVIHADSFIVVARLWTLSTYNHALFVVPVAFYLLWRRRESLAFVPVEPSWPGLALLGLIALAWYIGREVALQALEHAAAIFAIPALVLTVLGTAFCRAALLPLAFLLLAIPVGESLIPWLMEVTADVAASLLGLFGIPAYRYGMIISLPAGDFEVRDVCAGLNHLLASVPLSLLIASWAFRSPLARTVFVLATAVIFVMGNGVRAFIVMVVASATEMQWFTGPDHVYFGMGFFALLMAGVCWVGWKHSDPPEVFDEVRGCAPRSANRTRLTVALSASAAVLALGPIAAASTTRFELQVTVPVLPYWDGCTGPRAWSAGWNPSLTAPRAEVRGTYGCGEFEAHGLIAVYSGQEPGRELASNSTVLMPRMWETRGLRGNARITLDGMHALELNEVLIEKGDRATLIWHWYEVDGRPVRSMAGVKFREALSALALRPAVSRVYLIAASAPSDRVEALRPGLAELARTVWVRSREERQ